jgi:HSP20 family protein
MPRRDVEEWLVQVGRGMSSLAEELAAGRPRVAPGKCWEPRADVFEEETRLLVRVEIAGVRGEDIGLHYVPERHALVVRGVRPEPMLDEGVRRAAHQLEIMYGEFSREIALPAVSIDARGIRAQYRNGMLLIMVPKLERVFITHTTIVKEL